MVPSLGLEKVTFQIRYGRLLASSATSVSVASIGIWALPERRIPADARPPVGGPARATEAQQHEQAPENAYKRPPIAQKRRRQAHARDRDEIHVDPDAAYAEAVEPEGDTKIGHAHRKCAGIEPIA